MNVGHVIIWLVAVAGVLFCGVSAAKSFAVAFTGRAPRPARPSSSRDNPDQPGPFSDHDGGPDDDPIPGPAARCACCDYDLAGLEHGYCPECGWSYTPGSRLPWRKRFRALIRGGLAAALTLACLIAPHAARHGVYHLTPSALLAAALPIGPIFNVDSPALTAEIRSRLECGRMRAWERDLLAFTASCTHRLASGDRDLVDCRHAAACILDRLAADDHVNVDALINLMEDPSGRVREIAVDGLGKLIRAGDDAQRGPALQRLLSAAVCDRDAEVRRRAVTALGAAVCTCPQAIGVLARAARDPAPRVRARAMYAMSACPRELITGEAALASVNRAARDADPGVREAATLVLSRLGERADAAVIALAMSLHDTSADVRRSAADLLARLGPRAAPAWGALVASLADIDPAVQASAAAALRAIGS